MSIFSRAKRLRTKTVTITIKDVEAVVWYRHPDGSRVCHPVKIEGYAWDDYVCKEVRIEHGLDRLANDFVRWWEKGGLSALTPILVPYSAFLGITDVVETERVIEKTIPQSWSVC